MSDVFKIKRLMRGVWLEIAPQSLMLMIGRPGRGIAARVIWGRHVRNGTSLLGNGKWWYVGKWEECPDC